MCNKVNAACTLDKTNFFELKIRSEINEKTLLKLVKNIKDDRYLR